MEGRNEQVLHEAIIKHVDFQCNEFFAKSLSTVEEKVKAKRKAIEEEHLPLINSRIEASRKVENMLQKSKTLENDFKKATYEFGFVENSSNTARSEYERLRVRLTASNNRIGQLKEKIGQIKSNALYEEVDEEGLNWARGADEAEVLMKQLKSYELKASELKKKQLMAESEQENFRSRFDKIVEDIKEKIQILDEKKLEANSLKELIEKF